MTGYGYAHHKACCFQGAGMSTIAVFTKNRTNPTSASACLGAGRKRGGNLFELSLQPERRLSFRGWPGVTSPIDKRATQSPHGEGQ